MGSIGYGSKFHQDMDHRFESFPFSVPTHFKCSPFLTTTPNSRYLATLRCNVASEHSVSSVKGPEHSLPPAVAWELAGGQFHNQWLSTLSLPERIGKKKQTFYLPLRWSSQKVLKSRNSGSEIYDGACLANLFQGAFRKRSWRQEYFCKHSA